MIERDREIIAPGVSTASKLDFTGLLQTVGDHLLNPECSCGGLSLPDLAVKQFTLVESLSRFSGAVRHGLLWSSGRFCF